MKILREINFVSSQHGIFEVNDYQKIPQQWNK